MHSRNPISSLSRRLLVGAKIREMDFIGALGTASTLPPQCQTTPEPDDYAKKWAEEQLFVSIELASQRKLREAAVPAIHG